MFDHRITPFRAFALVAGIAAALALAWADTPLEHYGSFGSRPALAASITLLMSIWWLTEALPIYVTACVPLVVYPLTTVFSENRGENLARSLLPYADPYIFLFMGGMCIAAAMQQWDLHRRIALAIMRAIGSGPERLLAGFLAGTAFVSLWISNTATAAMMVPIGIAVVAQLERRAGMRLVHYGGSIMLSIAYASNIGGIGTKIGTAPNAQFSGFMAQRGIEIGFLSFMAVGLPFVLMMLPITWLALWRGGRKDAPRSEAGAEALREEWQALGPMKRGEWVVLAVFLGAAALWIASKPLGDVIKPRVTAFKLTSAHIEAGIAMAAAFVLALWPVGRRRRALEPHALRAVPWETLLLLGGGFAMAAAIEASGLSRWLADQLAHLRTLAPLEQTLLASFVTVTLSAFASNAATIAVMLGVLADSVSPEIATSVLFAATIACSCDFALPAGTPPNAIVFGSGYVSIPRMAKTGIVLDLIAATLAALWCWLVAGAVI